MKDLTESTQSLVVRARRLPLRRADRRRPGLLDLDPAQRLGIFTQPGGDRLALGAHHHPPRQARRLLRAQGDVHAARPPPPGVDTTLPTTAGAPSGSGSRPSPRRPSAPAVTPSSTRSASCRRTSTPSAAGGPPTTGSRSTPSISVDFLDEGPVTTSSPVEALRAFTRSLALPAVLRAPAVSLLHRAATSRRRRSGAPPDVRRLRERRRGHRRACCGRWRARPTFSRRAEVP